jgi:hypothetical protein
MNKDPKVAEVTLYHAPVGGGGVNGFAAKGRQS